MVLVVAEAWSINSSRSSQLLPVSRSIRYTNSEKHTAGAPYTRSISGLCTANAASAHGIFGVLYCCGYSRYLKDISIFDAAVDTPST